MTVHTLKAGTPGLMLYPGYIVAFEAINPTTGAAVTGVTVGSIAIFGRDENEGDATASSGPLWLVPGTG